MANLHRRSEALAQGMTDNDMRRLCRTEAWTRIRQGSFADSAELAALSPDERHVLLATATLDASRSPDAVLSHVSAALLLGLPRWGISLTHAHITRYRATGSATKGRRIVHASPYLPDEITTAHGYAVTSPARTVADIARTTPFEQAVCVADAAARRYGLGTDEVLAVLERRPTNPGNASARRVALFMDGRAENPGESRSRVMLRANGFEPDLQANLYDHHGSWIATVDFLLEELGSSASSTDS